MATVITYKRFKRYLDQKQAKAPRDEHADYEDIRYDLELAFDEDLDHRNLGFLLRENANIWLGLINGFYSCYFINQPKIINLVPGRENPQDIYENIKFKRFSGTYSTYHSNGALETETTLTGGRLHGRRLCFFPNFQKALDLNFFQGQKHGICTEYYEDGSIFARTIWKHGKRHGEKYVYAFDGSYEKFIYEGGKLIDKQQ